MEELNLVEILKDCPKGTRLYSTIFGEVEFVEIHDTEKYITILVLSNKMEMAINSQGRLCGYPDGECILFPSKENRNWTKFNLSYRFKEGDILYVKSYYSHIFIFKKISEYGLYCHAELVLSTNEYIGNGGCVCDFEEIREIRIATEEEKNKLLDAIKENDCKWNANNKKIEKINKFDVNTLQPFDKVLARVNSKDEWKIDFFSHTSDKEIITLIWGYSQCIPYNDDTKHLLGTSNEAPEFYKTLKNFKIKEHESKSRN